MKTTQLRRYTLKPGASNDFVAWWQKVIPPLRVKSGFIVEWAYLDTSAGEFFWAVSVPGNALEFENVEAAYLSSPERAKAFTGMPDWVSNVHVALVQQVCSPSAAGLATARCPLADGHSPNDVVRAIQRRSLPQSPDGCQTAS